ncbi:MAG TPA: hypothetical protein DCE71_03335, partial [Parachlamydiales bacterium]|nr:hypothetical protein [Parachlamydiales bacterium]
MSAIVPSNKIFASPKKAFKQSSNLIDLLSLNANLPPKHEGRIRVLNPVISILEKTISNGQNTPLEESKTQLIEAFNAYQSETESGRNFFARTYHKPIAKIFIAKIESVSTVEDLQSIQKKAVTDCKTLLATSELAKKSLAGHNGPTLLVHYTKPQNRVYGEKQISYVLKWTDKEEICGHLIYDFFSKAFSSNLIVPKSTWYDFQSHLYMNIQGRLEALEHPFTENLSATFNSVPSAIASSIKILGEKVMIIEKLSGGNLGEFFKRNYQTLTEKQKKYLFQQLGKLAVIDILLGNNDRLFTTKRDREAIQLDNYKANLGNVMITIKDGEEPTVHPIDNGVNVEMIENPILRRNYLHHIDSLFKEPKAEMKIASLVINSIRNTIDNGFHLKENFRKEAFEPVRNDSEAIALPALQEGAEQMISSLK